MSKERLEDIKHEYDFLGVIHRSEHIEWLIEQAERMQELEQKNDRLKQEADFWRVEDREMMRLSHENKCYREAIIEALHGLKTLPSVAPRLYLISILDKALECEG